MILLKRLELSNFLSHEHTELGFDESVRLLIDGKSGAGKSAIVDGLIWGLYNVGRVQNRSLIKQGASKAIVTVELLSDETYYRIVRSVTSKGTHSVDVFTKQQGSSDWTPLQISGTKNIQGYIEKEILKCSYALFINSVCYPQENPDNFVRQTPAKRKDLLLELVGAQSYEEYALRVRDAISSIENQLASGEGKQTQLEAELARVEELAKPLASLEAELLTVNTATVQTEEALQALQKNQTELQLVADKLGLTAKESKAILNQIAEVTSRIDVLAAKIKELRNLDETLIKQKLERRTVVWERLQTLEGQLKNLYTWKDQLTALILTKPSQINFDSRIQEVVRQQKTLSARVVPPEQCPHCGKEHNCRLLGEELKQQMNSLDAHLLILKEEERTHKEALEAYEAKIRSHESLKPQVDTEELLKLRTEYSELERYVELGVRVSLKDKAIGELNDEIVQLEETKKKFVVQHAELMVTKESLEKKLNGLPDVSEEKRILTATLTKNKIRVGEINEAIGIAKSSFARIEVITKLILKNQEGSVKARKDLESLKLLKEALGANGIKSIVIDYLLPYLEERINQVLYPLSDFRIRFNTQKSSVAGDSIVEGLFITVINSEGKEMDFDAYSGGQKVKILFAITEGLAQMQKIGFRILDEAVIGLDEDSGDQFAEAIMTFRDRFSQLLCISHVQQIKDLFEDKITVRYLGGLSTVDK